MSGNVQLLALSVLKKFTSFEIYRTKSCCVLLSQMTLMPGDVISTGSPGGGGLARAEWFLNAGDVIECEIEKIGTLVNAVVDEPRS